MSVKESKGRLATAIPAMSKNPSTILVPAFSMVWTHLSWALTDLTHLSKVVTTTLKRGTIQHINDDTQPTPRKVSFKTFSPSERSGVQGVWGLKKGETRLAHIAKINKYIRNAASIDFKKVNLPF